MKLISMVDFVLQNKANFKGYKDEDYGKFAYNHVVRLENYAKFLKQPLKLEMFVPCDEDGNPLEEPEPYEVRIGFDESDIEWNKEELEEYIKANEKVLFEGFELEEVADGGISIVLYNNYFFGAYDLSKSTFVGRRTNIIEGLIKNDLKLTPNAIKQLGL